MNSRKGGEPAVLGIRFQIAVLFLIVAAASHCAAADLERVRVSDNAKGFVLSKSGKPFVPWGFNYDHEGDGKLIEDYWDEKWPTVESAFQEMKELGANVVRIHLQFGKFMESPTKPRQHSLKQLARLVKLAEQTGLYLDLTGLGCYHKQDVPEWYDKLSERNRWAAQAEFWEAVAKTCADSPAIFCYDLMNEPVVPGGDKKRDDWLGPGFGGKHFVQFISLERQNRKRPDVARQWIKRLVAAIRKHDKRHLITVGLVPWSLDRPGLTSGFVPEKIADDLDFIAMHIYPEKGKVAEAVETVKGFAAVGKPVVIEEFFPLKCDAKELEKFIDQSRKHATGWIGFYWGKTPNEYQPPKTIRDAITLSWLELFQKKRSSILGRQDGPAPYLANGVTAHRGNSSEFPENTIPAFQSGINVGADWIELDILRTKDGKLVVIHDLTTRRVGDRNLVVAESAYKELVKVDVATDFRRRSGKTITECPPQKIPLLKDVLRLVMKQSRTRVSIQPKMNCVADAVALVKAMKAERWVGFNDGNLQYMAEVKRLAPKVTVFWDRGKDTNIDEDIRIAKKHGFEALILHYEGVTPEKVKKIKAAGIEIGAWTVNERATMKRLLEVGVKRLYTDNPRLLLSLKSKKGE
jgi:glycerophosphoryl diester phosphodiesterase